MGTFGRVGRVGRGPVSCRARESDWYRCCAAVPGHHSDRQQKAHAVSISSSSVSPWTPPAPSRPSGGIKWGAEPGGTDPASPFPSASDARGGSPSTASGTGGTTPFQQLSTDIQSMLVQAQGDPAQTATAGGNAAATEPAQTRASDIQARLPQSQGGQAAGDAAEQPGSAGQTQAHHAHHHHHHSPGDASRHAPGGASGGVLAPSGSVFDGPSGSAPSAAHLASKALAADIIQALQAYGRTAQSGTGVAAMA